jgi:hypothetical protein
MEAWGIVAGGGNRVDGSSSGDSGMSDALTDKQIALLCAIGERDPSNLKDDQKRDLAVLIFDGYVEATGNQSGPIFKLTEKGAAFLGERGAGAE